MTSIENRFALLSDRDVPRGPAFQHYRYAVRFGPVGEYRDTDSIPFVSRKCAEQFAKAWAAGDDEAVEAAIQQDPVS